MIEIKGVLTTYPDLVDILMKGVYFSGINLEECVAPIPGLPCLTGLYVIENSPR